MRLRTENPPLPALRLQAALRWNGPQVAALVAFAALVARLPIMSGYAINWDSVQFALATEHFDLEAHRPHPPGYIGYVTAGRLLNFVTGDANTSFVLLSVAAGVLAPALFLWLALRLLPRPRAIAATLLFASSPLLWLYSGVGLTYALEAALALGFGFTVWQANRQQGRWLLGASLTLAALGAVRQTGIVLLLPLWLWALWPAAWTLRLQAGALLAAACLAWLVPLLWLSGGPAAYVRELRALSEVVTTANSLWAGTEEGIHENLRLVGLSLLAMLGAGLLLMAGRPRFAFLDRAAVPFLALWVLPALTVFTAMHMGQAGYALVLAPPFFLLLGGVLPESIVRGAPGAAAVAAAVVLNALLVLGLPAILYRDLSPDSELAIQLRQLVPSLSDDHWEEVIGFISEYDPQSTAILSSISGPKFDSSYRHTSYYLPEYRVYGVGPEWGVRLGYLYTARYRQDDYSISRPSIARSLLALPSEVRHLVIADSRVMTDFRFALPLTRHVLDDSTSVWTAEVEPGTTLVFNEDGSVVAAEGRAVFGPAQLAPSQLLK
jgi:hypothetical protein